MAFVEHGLCQHKDADLDVALALALECVEATASLVEEQSILASMKAAEPVWHRGVLLIGGER